MPVVLPGCKIQFYTFSHISRWLITTLRQQRAGQRRRERERARENNCSKPKEQPKKWKICKCKCYALCYRFRLRCCCCFNICWRYRPRFCRFFFYLKVSTINYKLMCVFNKYKQTIVVRVQPNDRPANKRIAAPNQPTQLANEQTSMSVITSNTRQVSLGVLSHLAPRRSISLSAKCITWLYTSFSFLLSHTVL